MDRPAWQTGFPIQATDFAPTFDSSMNHEDWEDWLRWDPTAEPASPEDGTLHSGSSKNNSPIQKVAWPVQDGLFGKANDTLAPPMVMGEDALDFGGQDGVGGEEILMFGNPNDTTSFDFQPLMPLEQRHAAMPMPRIDTTWPPPADMDTQNIDLSALSNDTYHTLHSAGPVSSTAPSMNHSPASTSQNRTSMSSTSPDPPKQRGGRKRKAEIEQERQQQEQNDEFSQEDGDGPPIKKTSHNVIEKRYRNNLNDKIIELRNSVPSLRAMGRANGTVNTEDLEGLTPAHKLNKATVMAKATEYIRHLEKRNKTMSDEMTALRARLMSVETTIGKSRNRQASMSTSPPNRPRQTSVASQNGSPGFLNVPPEQSRFGQHVVQQQYMQSQQHPAYASQPAPPVEAQNQAQYVNARGGGGGVMSKVMLGTMAGLMIMEGFSEHDESSSRALSGFPTHLFRRDGLNTQIPSSSAALSRRAMLPLLKLMLLIGVLAYLVLPFLIFAPRRKQKQATRTPVRSLPHLPSLASPIEVRRKAWLTAIQTVWVPKHFLLEVCAVTAKMISLSLRRIIGSEAYNTLTGANKDDETARIKAWDIAIDAQLAGGDAEVSYYRLLLTLMESGTLPDSPTRLMQKAVHFRVFFWEVANAGYGNMSGFKQFTEKVGKFYWESARRLQKELLHAQAAGKSSQIVTAQDNAELLPDHLASLVELDCDEVLSDEMIQRAWNLAWNKPSAYCTKPNAARDAVVEDHAIRSPLDAVAAWYAHMTVDDTLLESLSSHASTLDTEYYVALAVSVAPPVSATLARALAAKAVLSNLHREGNILVALEALPGVEANDNWREMNVVSHIPASPDVCTALTLAKLLSLASPTSPVAAHDRASDMVASLHIPPGCFTLLTAIAALRLLKLLASERRLSIDTKHGLEDLAANLRVWVGTSAGRNAGLSREESVFVVQGCLDAARKVGGWWVSRDSGYGSGEGSPVREAGEVGPI